MTLTKGPLNVVSEPDRPARETDAEDAIEVTPEMIEAGCEEIALCESPAIRLGLLLERFSHQFGNE